MRDSQLIVGLDIGAAKITTVIGELATDGTLDIIGQGTVPSLGFSRGAVINLERAVQSIKESVHKAERVSGVNVTNVYVSIGGSSIRAITSHGLSAIRRGLEITQADVERAIENAQAVPMDAGLEVLHILPQEYVVDGQDGIRSPVGMQGVRLEVDVHIVACQISPLTNLRRCIQEADLIINGFVLGSLASGMATISYPEQNQTIINIDMGSSKTDLAIFRRGNLAHSSSIPIGGEHVTSDLAQILRIPQEEAENVKLRYGAAIPDMADSDLILEITTAQGKTHAIGATELSKVIKPRIAEIFALIRDEIDSVLGPAELQAQQIILSGGAANLPGVKELAQDRFKLPTRLGIPTNIGGLADIVDAPEFSTAVGLVLFGVNRDGRLFTPQSQPQPQPQPQPQTQSQPASLDDGLSRLREHFAQEQPPKPERKTEEVRRRNISPEMIAAARRRQQLQAQQQERERLQAQQQTEQQDLMQEQEKEQPEEKGFMAKIRNLLKEWT